MGVKEEFIGLAQEMNARLEGFWEEVGPRIDDLQRHVLTYLGKDLCQFLEIFESRSSH